ncbi:MAG TPA: NAD-dependent deacylase, partial [Chitinophagaceae bacterium]|nr:NAD-dependent deacylase [Chitinophagaceae bacterium]
VWFEEPVPKMEEAVPLVHDADIFVIIGTSLVVYPAAGLVHYVRSGVPVFLLDKKIPVMQSGIRFRPIEQPAAAGAAELTMLLKQLC